MGITIHYTLITDDYRSAILSVLTAKKMAMEAGYRYEDIAERAYLTYSRFNLSTSSRDPERTREYLAKRYGGYREEVLDEVPDEPPWCWILVNYPEPGRYTYAVPWLSNVGRPVHYEGIIVEIPTAEPLILAFYNLGYYYVCDGFTKTQPFTADEVEPNLRFHEWICGLLRRLEEGGNWWKFYVSDEGGYYETLDESELLRSFEASAALIYGLAGALDKAAEDFGGSVEVGGKVDVRRRRRVLEEFYEGGEGYQPYQSSLDDFVGVD